jgi:uncharacterized protein YjdB
MEKAKFYFFLLIAVTISMLLNAQTFNTGDYKKAEWMTARFYGAQRASMKNTVPSNWMLMNHGTGVDFDNDNDAGYDLTGGWYDCGDHPMYGQTQFYSAYVLLKGYDMWPTGYEDHYSQSYSGYNAAQDFTWESNGHDPDGIPDIINEVKYATDFFIKCTRSETQFYSQKGQGTYDHKHWLTAVKMATNITTEGGQPRLMYGNVNDASMSSFCGATLALMSRIYKKYDSAYAATCLTHALYAYTYSKNHPSTAGSPEGGFYVANSNWKDDYASMCTELYYATNDVKYKTEALSYESGIGNHNYCFQYNNNEDIAAYNLATLGSTGMATLLNDFANMYKGTVDANGIYTGGDNTWGTLRYNGNSAFIVAANNVFKKVSGVDPFIYKQIDFILGNNTLGANGSKISFVVGFGANSAKHPHQRGVYLNDDDVPTNSVNCTGCVGAVIEIPIRNAQYGCLVGGIRTGTFNDVRDNYQSNEGGIDYSAGLVGALAYILAQQKSVIPTSMTLSPKPLTLSLNNTSTITVTIKPTGAPNDVTWTVRNPIIASITGAGVVTGLAAGSTYIVAKTNTGNFIDSVLCTVTKINVTGITMGQPTIALTVGSSTLATATTVPTNASIQNILWSSSDTTIATVSATGTVKAIAIGTATISAVTVEGSFKGSTLVTVSANPKLYVIHKTLTPPVIDGSLDESFWTMDKSIAKAASGTKNNTETMGVLWDDTYIYIGVKVLDASIITTNSNNYDNDAVELYFDMNNNGGSYDGSDRQWIYVVNATSIWEQQNRNTGVLFASKLITGGYTMEFAIPWSTFSMHPDLSVLYGFDIAVDDADSKTSGSRDNQVTWMGDGNNYQDLSNVGDLQLSNLSVGGTTQSISLTPGWNSISFNVVPTDSSIASVFNGIISHVVEIKNTDAYYRPSNQAIYNTLKSIEQGKGYLVNCDSTVTLTLTGSQSKLTTTQIQSKCRSGWNLLGCPYQSSTAISTAFDNTKISLIKSLTGFYIPGGTSNTISTIIPGVGYFVKLK